MYPILTIVFTTWAVIAQDDQHIVTFLAVLMLLGTVMPRAPRTIALKRK